MLVQLAGIGFVLLGIVYLFRPEKVYHFGPDFLRDTRSETSDLDSSTAWVYRFIGFCLVVMGTSYIMERSYIF